MSIPNNFSTSSDRKLHQLSSRLARLKIAILALQMYHFKEGIAYRKPLEDGILASVFKTVIDLVSLVLKISLAS